MSEETKKPRKLGEMNGWSVPLAKFAWAQLQIVFGLALTWGIWVTKSTWDNNTFRKSGERYTQLMAEVGEREMRVWVHRNFIEDPNSPDYLLNQGVEFLPTPTPTPTKRKQ